MKYFSLLKFHPFDELYMVLDALTGCVLKEFHLCGELVLLDDLTGHMYLCLLEFQLLFELVLWGQLMAAGLFGHLHVVMLKKDARLDLMVKSDVLKVCLFGAVVQV